MARDAEKLESQAARLKQLKEMARVRNRDIAAAADVSERQVARWLAGTSDIDGEHLKAVALYFGTSPDFIEYGVMHRTPDPFPATQLNVTEQLKRIEQALVTVIELLTGRLDPRAVEAAQALDDLVAGLHDLAEPQRTPAARRPSSARAAAGRSSA